MSRTKLPMVTIAKGASAVVEICQTKSMYVEVFVECAGCGRQEIASCSVGPKAESVARKRLRECVIGWAVIFDRDVNDGDYPYCPACIGSIFPQLSERIAAEKAGKPLPPHNPPIPSGGAA